MPEGNDTPCHPNLWLTCNYELGSGVIFQTVWLIKIAKYFPCHEHSFLFHTKLLLHHFLLQIWFKTSKIRNFQDVFSSRKITNAISFHSFNYFTIYQIIHRQVYIVFKSIVLVIIALKHCIETKANFGHDCRNNAHGKRIIIHTQWQDKAWMSFELLSQNLPVVEIFLMWWNWRSTTVYLE